MLLMPTMILVRARTRATRAFLALQQLPQILTQVSVKGVLHICSVSATSCPSAVYGMTAKLAHKTAGLVVLSISRVKVTVTAAQ